MLIKLAPSRQRISDFARNLSCVSASVQGALGYDAAALKPSRAIDSGVSWQPSEYGLVQRGTTVADGAAYGSAGFSSLVPVDSQWTVMMLVRIATTGSRRIIMGDFSAAGTNESVYLEQQAANTWRGGWVTSGNAARTVSGGSVTTGWHWLELQVSSSATSLWVDNVLIDADPAKSTQRAGTDYRIGRGGAFTSLGFDGDIAHHFIFASALSAADRQTIRNIPQLCFAPRSIWVPVSVGGGSASSITAAAGASTASTLAASSTAASTPTAAAGTATASTVAATSTAASAITSATGAATASTLTGSAVVAGAITAAAGVGTGGTLAGTTLAAGSAAIVAAGGVATTATLGGSSVAAAAIGVAAGAATASVMGGPGAEPVARLFAGGFPRREQFRKGYIIKGVRYWLTEEELAVMVAQMLAEISRGDIKQVTAGKPKTISKKTWDAIQVEARIEAVAKQFDDTDEDEDESILMML